MATNQARYIGADGDDNQLVHMADTMFVKGQWKSVDSEHPQFAKLANNPTFEVKGGDQRPEVEGDDVAEIEAAKVALRDRGETVRGNPNLETLRKRLADVTKDEDAAEPVPPAVGG